MEELQNKPTHEIADFTNIYELKKNLDIPVICNGDVEHYDDGMAKVQDLDWFMIGRKSFWNPWCFLWEKHFSKKKDGKYNIKRDL